MAVVAADGHSHNLKELKAEYEKKRADCKAELEQLIAGYEVYSKEWATYNKALADYKQWETKWNAQSDALLEQMHNLPPITKLPSTAMYEEVLVELKRRKDAASRAIESLQAGKMLQHSLKTQLQTSVKQLDKLVADYDPNYKFEDVRAQMDKYTRDCGIRSACIKEIAQYKQLISSSAQNLDKLQKQQERSTNASKYRKVLQQVCGWFHRDSYPAAVAQYYLSTLNRAWNDMLTTLDVPFTAQILSDLDISLSFDNNANAFVEDASGGQVTCLSLAFLLSANRLFAPDTGLLVLDEPTYGADADHVEGIANVLRQAQGYAASTGMQIIVVTHEPALRNGFDHVITLD